LNTGTGAAYIYYNINNILHTGRMTLPSVILALCKLGLSCVAYIVKVDNSNTPTRGL